jgi:dienelactone hydrolase
MRLASYARAVSEIALFHSALGLRPSEHAFADRLRAAGHVVHTPDLYEGRTFESLDDGVAHGDGLGLDEIGRRAAAAVEPMNPELVYAGFSLGACAAQILAQKRPGAKGALLYHAALPSEAFGGWPAGVALQIHSMEDDEWFEPKVEVARPTRPAASCTSTPAPATCSPTPPCPTTTRRRRSC